MTPRPGTVLRPTGRGIVLAVAAPLLWLAGDITGLVAARQIAAALLLILLLGALCMAVIRPGLHLRRELLDDAVPAGGTARVRLRLAARAPITFLPLGRGVVREHLPAALGGQGDLPLAPRMDHLLAVERRGTHPLGPRSILVRDLLGVLHLRRTETDDLQLIGLPAVEQISAPALRRAGIAAEAGTEAHGAAGPGEIGPLARPYATGDDIRRVHWRASARTGRLMTREEEPASARSAVIILDTTGRPALTPALEDRLVSHAASLLQALSQGGWETRVLDASGDEITRTPGRDGRSTGSPLRTEADALAARTGLLALADTGFDDDPASGRGRDHAAGHTAYAIALGIDDGEPFAGLDLDRFAGRAARRIALALASEPADPSAPELAAEPVRGRLGAWELVRGSTGHALDALLAVTAPDHEVRR